MLSLQFISECILKSAILMTNKCLVQLTVLFYFSLRWKCQSRVCGVFPLCVLVFLGQASGDLALSTKSDQPIITAVKYPQIPFKPHSISDLLNYDLGGPFSSRV